MEITDTVAINGGLIQLRSEGKERFYTVDKYFLHHPLTPQQTQKMRRVLHDYILCIKSLRNKIEAREILSCRNAEIRAWLMNRFGFDRFVIQAGAKVIHSDNGSQLLRIDITNGQPIVAVKVKDSTTGRIYILSVPPTMETCKEAIAWTFGMTRKQYSPKKET